MTASLSAFSENFQLILKKFQPLASRAEYTMGRLSKIREKFEQNQEIFSNRRVTVFCAGSIGRKDSGIKSDLDLFVIAEADSSSKCNNLCLLGVV